MSVAERWQICRMGADGKWDLTDPKVYDDPRHAIVVLGFELGFPMHSERDGDAWRVNAVDDGREVACIRQYPPKDSAIRPGEDITSRTRNLGPLKRWRGLTWIGWLNYLVLRWFLFRIGYILDEDNTISRYYVKFVSTWRWDAK